jgi:type IV fimbrial biogenesis protein FimT
MSRCYHRAPRGFSLIELLLVLIIIATSLCLGLPALSDALARVQLGNGLNQWMTTLAQARISAVNRGRNVVVCPAIGDRCALSPHWHQGWIMFEDANRNTELDTGEVVLQRGDVEQSLRVVSSNGRQRARFRPDGSSEGSNLTLTVCGERGPAHARTIVLSNGGRARSGTASPEQAAHACSAPHYRAGG